MHDAPIPDERKPFVFAALGGFTCSICAPLAMSRDEVEEFADDELPGDEPWRAVDKSKPPISIGAPTPNPCNLDPCRRLHWFLVRGRI